MAKTVFRIPVPSKSRSKGDLRRVLEGLFNGRHGYAYGPDPRSGRRPSTIRERGKLRVVVAALHSAVIALAAGVRSVRIGVGPRLVEIVDMEVEWHDPLGAIAQPR